MDMKTLIGAIDQGTSSSRFLVFSANDFQLITYHQVQLKLISKQQGWCEIDPDHIVATVLECIEKCAGYLKDLSLSYEAIKAIGLTNQRETTILWDKITGRPLYNAIVWLDTRTESLEERLKNQYGEDNQRLKKLCGLPISTYFSAPKIKWLIDNVPEVQNAIKENRCAFGTVDSWLLWNLIGDKSCHLTDVTNASRTMLMNLHTLEWDDELCAVFDIPRSILPEIRSSAEVYGRINQGSLKGVLIGSVLGDQHAALIGHLCLSKGCAKNTYGTGCFLLYNTGNDIVYSTNGLLTTVAYKFGNEKPVYALEGSIATAGACINWLRDNLKLIENDKDTEEIANTVDDTSDVYFVPAFSGLYAPYWRRDARGLIIGLTQFATKAHVIRAALEAIAFQNVDIVNSMNKDCGVKLKELQVSGGMTSNKLLMQMQADLLGIPIIKPVMSETTSFGAALAAGKTIGVWTLDDHQSITINTEVFHPTISEQLREKRYMKWKKAIYRSIGWDESSIKTEQSFFSNLFNFKIHPVVTIALPLMLVLLFKIYKI